MVWRLIDVSIFGLCPKLVALSGRSSVGGILQWKLVAKYLHSPNKQGPFKYETSATKLGYAIA